MSQPVSSCQRDHFQKWDCWVVIGLLSVETGFGPNKESNFCNIDDSLMQHTWLVSMVAFLQHRKILRIKNCFKSFSLSACGRQFISILMKFQWHANLFLLNYLIGWNSFSSSFLILFYIAGVMNGSYFIFCRILPQVI